MFGGHLKSCQLGGTSDHMGRDAIADGRHAVDEKSHRIIGVVLPLCPADAQYPLWKGLGRGVWSFLDHQEGKGSLLG